MGGCSSAGSDPVAAMSPGSGGRAAASTGGSAAAECSDGGSCTCSDGRSGTEMCNADASLSCVCTGPAFTLDANLPFAACGGEPFGMWRAIKVTIDPTQTVAYQGFAETLATCAIAATSATTPDFRLDLENAGKFAMSNGAYELQFDALTSCVGKPQNCTLYGPRHSNTARS